MHGRYFGGIQVEANINDGKEEFGSIEVEGGDDSEEKRMQAYHEWMET